MDLMNILGGVLGAQEAPDASAGQQGKLAAAIMELLKSGQIGGLQGLIDLFQQKGLADVMESWVGMGQNKPVNEGQLKSVLGGDLLTQLAQKTGLPLDSIAPALSSVLPGIIDKLTPQGQVPDGDWMKEASSLIQAFQGPGSETPEDSGTR